MAESVARQPRPNRTRSRLPRRWRLLSWQRTVTVVAVSQFVAMIGFGLTVPFLPLYIQTLGITAKDEVATWAGVLVAAPAVPMAVLSPVWGVLADRYGRKVMLVRSILAGSLILVLMAFAGNVWHVLILRLFQGAFTGSNSAAVALTASIVPLRSAGIALAMVQTCVSLGSALGPVVGGITAPTIGFRNSFLLSAVFLFAAGIAVWLLVREQRSGRPAPVPAAALDTAESAGPASPVAGPAFDWRAPAFLSLLVLMAVSQVATMSAYPLVPLFAQQLEPVFGWSPETVAGFALAATSLFSSIGAPILGGLGDRVGHRRVVVASLIVAGVAYFPAAAATNALHLMLARAVVGFALSGFSPSLNALIARQTARGREGVAFGALATAQSSGSALGPILGSVLAALTDIRLVFGVSATLLVASGVGYAFFRLPAARPVEAEPVAEPAASRADG